ncbi:MAG: pseudaminic acid biosynthesis-associated protein PseG [Candidatus Saganbacteria bacterium]|uniref:Pseudaminic acid biosynthesis-associated protein PseG n=1 Tax=Candidatus Saganbacteria bacterium TaxID=2575572 RepID=A0A833L2P0_UNCSA|nr:MAG: pseudaminic acid biosynthesis-associated protein PseG [Candidatus Saganbacteria bacterium]
MKIAIRTEGGKGIGFGHIMRCLSLYYELEKRGAKPFFIVNSDESVLGQFKNVIKHFTFDWQNAYERTSELVKGIDVLVIDSYKMKAEEYIGLSKMVKLLVCLDDFNRINYPSGIVLNGSVCARKFSYPEKEDIIYLLGSEYAFLRREFCKPYDRIIKKDINNVLITFGGDDANNSTPRIMELLLNNFDCTLNVVIGWGFINTDYMDEYKNNKKVRFIFKPGAEAMRDLMLSCDIAISAGGQTTFELAVTGTPAIGICVADNQEMNLKGWSEVGFMKYAGWYNDSRFLENVKNCFDELRSQQIRKEASEIGKKYVDGIGSSRVATQILEKFDKTTCN